MDDYIQDVLNTSCLTPDCAGQIYKLRFHGPDGGILKEVSRLTLLLIYYAYLLQCFDAVGWAAGRASGWPVKN